MSGNTDPTQAKKPYVGPAPIQAHEPFYGREDETAELVDRLLARRVVLLHAASGAGKTSLIQAGLLPTLADEGLMIFSRLSISRQALPGQVGLDGRYNPYLLSVLMLLEENLPEAEQIPLAELADKNLKSYLDEKLEKAFSETERISSPQGLLIFDQFEELLTLDPNAPDTPDDLTGRLAFLRQLMPVLYDQRYYVLFAMREDYLAGLEPYLSYFPDRLSARYRLEFLNLEAARQAIQKPAADFGVIFEIPAIERLVDDLSQVSELSRTGVFEKHGGAFIEPVHLQVVCSNLWEANRPDPARISLADVQKYGNVDNALGNYYAARAKETSVASGVPERNLRRWFESRLITGQGLRSQVLSGADSEYGVTVEVIRAFVNSYLVREEQRRGATWLELAHDRLVEPVRQDNAAWFEQNLSLLQRQASIWFKSDAPDDLLLRGEALSEAQAWAKANPEELSEIDERYLAASLKAAETEKSLVEERQKRLESEQRAARRYRKLFTAALVVAVLALLLAGLAGYLGYVSSQRMDLIRDANEIAMQNAATAEAASTLAVANAANAQASEATALAEKERADEQKELAETALARSQASEATAQAARQEAEQNARERRAGELVALAIAQRETRLDQALLLGVEAFHSANNYLTRDLLLSNLTLSPQLEQFLPLESGIRCLAISPDGKRMAVGFDYGRISLMNLDGKSPQDLPLQRGFTTGSIEKITYSPDGRWLALGDDTGNVVLWDLNNLEQPEKWLSEHLSSISALAFSADGHYLAAASAEEERYGESFSKVVWWELTDGVKFIEFSEFPQKEVEALAFSDDNKTLVVAEMQGIVYRLSTKTGGLTGRIMDLKIFPSSLSFSPDGRILASGEGDGRVTFWDTKTGMKLREGGNIQASHISSLAFSPDGERLVSGSADGRLAWWVVEDQSPITPAWSGSSGWVSQIAITPDRSKMVTLTDKGLVLLWSVPNRPAPAIVTQAKDIRRQTEIAFSPDGKSLATGGSNGKITFWDIASRKPTGETKIGHAEDIIDLDFSPNGQILASAGENNSVRLWDTRTYESIGQLLMRSVTSIDFHPDGEILAVGSMFGVVHLWDVAKQQVIKEINNLGFSQVNCLTFSPDGTKLAIGGLADIPTEEQTTEQTNMAWIITIWDIEKLKVVGVFDTPAGGEIYSMVINSDGTKLLAGFVGIMILWDVNQDWSIGQIMYIPGYPSPYVNFTAFGKDNQILIAGTGWGQGISLWDMDQRRMLGDPLNWPGGVKTISKSPDGRYLASTTGDPEQPIILWEIDPLLWEQRACQIAGRNFSQAEWMEFFPGEEYRLTCPE